MSAIADALASGGTYLTWEHPGTTYTGIITDDPAGEHGQGWEWPGRSAGAGEAKEPEPGGAVGVLLTSPP